jgi:hypothetical protein
MSFTKGAIMGPEKTLWQDLVVADAARGVDGTGAIKVHTDGSVNWAKQAGDPFSLFRSDGFYNDFWEPINREFICALIGHNRFGTRGRKDTASAHPFAYEHITMVHNGTLREHGSILKELKEYPVDSEALCVGIARYGLQDALRQIDGAYALAYYDFKEQTINLIRNNERPLFVHVNKKDKLVSFASEKAMLYWALNRQRYFSAEWDHITSLQENELLSWSVKGNETKPRLKKIEVKGGSKVYYSTVCSVEPVADTRANKDSGEKNQRGDHMVPLPPAKKKGTNLALAVVKAFSPTTAANAENDYFPLPQWGGLVKGGEATIDLTDYDEVQNGIFIMKGENKGYPCLEFRCRVVGLNKVIELMSAAYVSATVTNILVPSDVGRKKGLMDSICYVSQPLPMYDVPSSVIIPNEEAIPPQAYSEVHTDE